MKVLVIGSGTMGSGIAQVIAQAGFPVVLNDINEEALKRGYAMIEKALAKLVVKEKLTEEKKQSILSHVELTTDLKTASTVDLVIEAAVENMDIKKKIFKQLDEIMKKETILATNTSSLSITEIASATNRPDQVIGVHFFNPAPIMKLVEIIKGIATSEETLNTMMSFVQDIKKEPVQVEEAPGFVVNRILIPMINEAIGILAEGVASAQDIDLAMKLGANHPIGPLALADLIGNDVVLAIMEVLYTEFADSKYRPHPMLRKMVRGNRLGRKTKQGFYSYE